MNLYIMRHGTTCWNEKGITQGRTNNRLSKSGIELTQKVAKENQKTQIDIIFCSPLMRTVQTANIMNTYHKVKIVKDDRLTEIDQGIFSGKVYNHLTEEQKKLKSTRSKQCGMESYDQVFERTKDFFDFLKKEYFNKTVLVITHNVVASLLEKVICDKSFDAKDRKSTHGFDNAQVKFFQI